MKCQGLHIQTIMGVLLSGANDPRDIPFRLSALFCHIFDDVVEECVSIGQYPP